MIDTMPHPSGNEDPDAVSTAAEGYNEPLTEAELSLMEKLLKDIKPAPFQRVSKHRAGRTKPLTKEQRRKRDRFERRVVQARKTAYLEHRADQLALWAAIERD